MRYPELPIRPHTTHKLEPLLLALVPFMAGESVPVHWARDDEQHRRPPGGRSLRPLQVEGLIRVQPGEASGSPIAWSARERATATDSART